jgi:hypothetical protein
LKRKRFFETSVQVGCERYKEWAIEVLWPRIDEFVDLWTRTKTTDYFAAGKAMQEAIREARLKAPDWPIKHTEALISTKPTSDDLDDDIPF